MESKAFVLFSVGPVQPFIAASRTVRDLWTGSFLLAWLTRQAMEPIRKAVGPEAFVWPDLRLDPMAVGRLRAPCLPNRFLAEVPEEKAEHLAEACRQAFWTTWQEVCAAVREALETEINRHPGLVPDWQESVNRLWDAQVNSFFDVRVVVSPWSGCPAAMIEELLGPRDGSAGGVGASCPASPEDQLWTDWMQLVSVVLAAEKAIRKVTLYQPAPDGLGMYGPKCTLLGTYEQLGPSELSRSAPYWREFAERVHVKGVRVRAGERLCAVSLVKRFAWPAYFAPVMDEDPRQVRFEDTATIAAAQWLATAMPNVPAIDPQEVRQKHKEWSGRWLHWNKRDQEPDEPPCPKEVWDRIVQKRKAQGPPPSYYAILMMDGDRMGQRLRERPGREHPQRISRTLADFALHYAENTVEDHYGTLVYCGGDDLLALLPTSQVLGCASQARRKFQEVWQKEYPDCHCPTLSAGIAIVHHKEDLRFALDEARRAEKLAKHSGRDILCIRLCRRSGEHQTALCPWGFVETVQGWVEAFLPPSGSPNKLAGASDRWAYHLYQELRVLEGLPLEAMKAELRRQVDRAEEYTRKRLFGEPVKEAGKRLVAQFEAYCNGMEGRVLEDKPEKDGKLLRHFLTLCQMASFLARRREE